MDRLDIQIDKAELEAKSKAGVMFYCFKRKMYLFIENHKLQTFNFNAAKDEIKAKNQKQKLEAVMELY